jgi:hypothetical protein
MDQDRENDAQEAAAHHGGGGGTPAKIGMGREVPPCGFEYGMNKFNDE